MLLSKLKFGMIAAALAIGLAPSAQAATVIPMGSPNFFIISGTPFSPSISAIFFNNYAAGETFDDIYTFMLPQNGMGSGSVSTSFSSNSNKIVITGLVVNGTPYTVDNTSSGYGAAVGGIPILAFGVNTIQLTGYAVGSGGYSGTATFAAAAVPEPASWAMMVGGLALLGFGLRRQRPQMAVQFS